MNQDFLATYNILGVSTVDTDINFNGFGPRVGLDGERFLGHGFLIYGKGFANFLVGQFDSFFVQQNVFIPGTPQSVTGFEDDRIVSQLELEVGLGWQNDRGSHRVSAGYYLAGWFNAVTTRDFVAAVQADDFDGVDDTLTFDGLALRVEWRY